MVKLSLLWMKHQRCALYFAIFLFDIAFVYHIKYDSKNEEV